MDAILTAAGAIAASALGIWITVRELRRRDRRVIRRELEDLTRQVDGLIHESGALRALLLEQRRHIYRLTVLMIEAGMNPPRPPDPSFDPGEYDEP